MSSTDNLCKQFGSRSDPTKCWVWFGSNCLTLWWFSRWQKTKQITKYVRSWITCRLFIFNAIHWNSAITLYAVVFILLQSSLLWLLFSCLTILKPGAYIVFPFYNLLSIYLSAMHTLLDYKSYSFEIDLIIGDERIYSLTLEFWKI